jgi:hypothetical protein
MNNRCTLGEVVILRSDGGCGSDGDEINVKKLPGGAEAGQGIRRSGIEELLLAAGAAAASGKRR